uniref:Ficolin-1 n=2 Tax=Culex pipiens TaxID=7175 RepID=A0A8D8BX30_CULPI
MLHSFIVTIFVGSIFAETVPANGTNGFGYELLLAKLDYMEYKFLELQVEVKEQGEQLLSNQEKNKQDLWEQSRQILEQQKFFASHEAFKQTIFELRPRKHPSNNSLMTEGMSTNHDRVASAKITSCKDEQSKRSGRYRMDVAGVDPFDVYCEQQFYGGGWIVIQNRFNGSEDFYRNWTDYKNGFGSVDGEFWLGLERIHALTKSQPRELLVHLEDFSGNVKYARYSSFSVGSEVEKYTFKTLDGHSGTLGDSLSHHKGSKFTTKDSDNDSHSSGNCANAHFGGWWYVACHASNLNGQYKNEMNSVTMCWHSFQSKYQGLKVSKMMIK